MCEKLYEKLLQKILLLPPLRQPIVLPLFFLSFNWPKFPTVSNRLLQLCFFTFESLHKSSTNDHLEPRVDNLCRQNSYMKGYALSNKELAEIKLKFQALLGSLI